MIQNICSINTKDDFTRTAIENRPLKNLNPFEIHPPILMRITYMEKKAIAWLARNEKGLTNYLNGMHGPYSDEVRELRTIVASHKPDKSPLSVKEQVLLEQTRGNKADPMWKEEFVELLTSTERLSDLELRLVATICALMRDGKI